MKTPTLNVQAIENGVVIDHIPAGAGLHILHYFHLESIKNRITVGFNLIGKTGSYKDLIKLENITFTEENIQQISFFAPDATINIIQNFTVVNKIKPSYPEKIIDIFTCPNLNCASHGEPVSSYFYVQNNDNGIKLQCRYCEKIYPFDVVSRR